MKLTVDERKGGRHMTQILSKAILILFVVGLVVYFVFAEDGFASDAENIRTQTQSMLENAQNQMEQFSD